MLDERKLFERIFGARPIAEQLIRHPEHLFRLRVAEYAEWVQMYASDEYGSLARWLAEHADELAATAGPRDLARMAAVYRRSLACEHGFWDMAYRAARTRG